MAGANGFAAASLCKTRKWHWVLAIAAIATGTALAQTGFTVGDSNQGYRNPQPAANQPTPARPTPTEGNPDLGTSSVLSGGPRTVRITDSREAPSVAEQGKEKEKDPFANFPRAEIWHGNQRVAPAKGAEDGSNYWPNNNESFKSVAQRMIREALRRAEAGDMKGALKLARWAKSFNVRWQPGEHSPEWLMSELPLIEKRRHNQQLLDQQRRDAELAAKAKAVVPRNTTVVTGPDPLTLRKSAELEERLIVLEDQLEKGQEEDPVVVSPTETTQDTTLNSVVSHVASFAGGVLLMCLVTSALVLVLFRKNSSRSGPVFRVEVVNNGQGETMLVPAGTTVVPSHQAADDGESTREIADPPPLETIPLDLSAGGPTYDEEIKRREAERVAREQALLQFVYEKNVELREELTEYERKAA